MKILIAIDSFKGSATSQELNQAASDGVHRVFPDAQVKSFQIADGGEGTMAAVHAALGGSYQQVETVDLLHCPMIARYLLLKEKVAVIEVAEVIGIDRISPSTDTIQKADSFGLGALLLDAKSKGVSEIVLSLGGTGTSDGGLGLIKSLGGDFEHLNQIEKFENIKITGLADVKNVYAGPTGYAKFFGAQKGGSPEILEGQDQFAHQMTERVKRYCQLDLQQIEGSGAAGGLGAVIAILGGQLESGFSKIARLVGLEEEVKNADLVITGEGRMDAQTANGKVPFGMAKLTEKYKIPTVAICGAVSDDLGQMNDLLLASFSIQNSAMPLEEAMENKRTLKNMKRTVSEIMKLRYK